MTKPHPRLLLNLARPWDAADTVPLARRSRAAGFDGVGLVDSPRLFPDGFVETQRVLAGSDVALAGPVVASLGLRHPVTVAGSLRTLEQHHPGRAFAVVGRGESSVANEGLPVPSLRDYREQLRSLRSLLRDDDGNDRMPGRLLGAASGPRTVAATVRDLDAVLLDVGVDEGTVGRAVHLARTSDPMAKVWLFVRAVVVDDPDVQARVAGPLLGSCAMRMVAAPDWFGLEADRWASVRALAESHDYRHHGTAEAATGGARAHEEAGALVRRQFLLVTMADEIIARIAGLTRLGVEGIVLAGALPGVVEGLEVLGAALRDGFAHGGATDTECQPGGG